MIFLLIIIYGWMGLVGSDLLNEIDEADRTKALFFGIKSG